MRAEARNEWAREEEAYERLRLRARFDGSPASTDRLVDAVLAFPAEPGRRRFLLLFLLTDVDARETAQRRLFARVLASGSLSVEEKRDLCETVLAHRFPFRRQEKWSEDEARAAAAKVAVRAERALEEMRRLGPQRMLARVAALGGLDGYLASVLGPLPAFAGTPASRRFPPSLPRHALVGLAGLGVDPAVLIERGLERREDAYGDAPRMFAALDLVEARHGSLPRDLVDRALELGRRFGFVPVRERAYALGLALRGTAFLEGAGEDPSAALRRYVESLSRRGPPRRRREEPPAGAEQAPRSSLRGPLSEAARALFEAAPWRSLREGEPFGVRDEETGTVGSVSVLGSAGEDFGISVCVGPAGFRLIREGMAAFGPDDLRYEADFVALRADPPGPSRSNVPPGARLGRFGTHEVTAYRKPPGLAARALTAEEAGLVARVAAALVRRSRAGKLGEWPDASGDASFPFLVLGSGEAEEWRRERFPEWPVSPSPSLLVPEPLRRKIATRREVGRWVAGLLTPPLSVREDQIRFLVLHDPSRDRLLHAEPFVGPEAVERAARVLLGAVAGEGGMGPYPGRPSEIVTDSVALERCAAGALRGVGVALVRRESVPELDGLRASFAEFLASGGGRGRERGRGGS